MNPNLNATLSALRTLLLVTGGLLAEHGLSHSTVYSYLMIAAGSIMVIGPAIWGVWSAIVNWHKAAAVGAQAALNMVTASGGSSGAPLTVATASELVANFASAEPPAKA